jgi:cytochrome c peroxidase
MTANRQGSSPRGGAARTVRLALTGLVAAATAAAAAGAATPAPALLTFADSSGAIATWTAAGAIDTSNPFFQSLGTNGRSCASCHVPSQGFSITPPGLRARYSQSNGADPVFAAVDGANCPSVRAADRAGHSLLLQHGLIRVALPLPLPPTAQFTVSVVHDPYGCAIAADATSGAPMLSVYRRPLPSTNLEFLSAVMWDGRETVMSLADPRSAGQNLLTDLAHQVVDATLGHAQASTAPTPEQQMAIVSFETGLYTAQSFDRAAGRLDAGGASGGPAALAAQPYYAGINDVLGKDPTGAPFDQNAMRLYVAWSSATGDDVAEARRDIAAGEQLFNSLPIVITNVRGLNDSAALGKPTSFTGTCTTCHDTPGAGNHSLPLPLDIGVGHAPLPGLEADPAIAAALAQLNPADLPVYLINNCPNPFNGGQPESFYTTDPGKALLTGQCSDFNRVKGPILRGLAARAPYFHNGAAANLRQVVEFYNARFRMALTSEQKQQLVAFLNSL